MKTLVSILVPTKDRPKFVSNIIRNFNRQDYGVENMELIIIDDGIINIFDKLPKSDNIRYYRTRPISIGEKRNKLIDYAKGEILIFFDDDDYYPKDKVSECVKVLDNNKNYLITGSSLMYIYFPRYNDILKYGPSWYENHSTCGTLAFKKEYCKKNKFPHKKKAEEKSFLNNYKNKLYQMNSLKAILVIGHDNNTVDKYSLRDKCEKTNLTLEDFGMSDKDKLFYRDLIVD